MYPTEVNPRREGNLAAYTRVAVVDIFGRTRCPRVSLGRQYGIDLDSAKLMVEDARKANPKVNIEASFTMPL